VNPSNPPKDPVVTPRAETNSRLIGEAQYFDVTTTEPDGEQVHYAVDWDSNGSIDAWVPGGTAFVDAIAQTPMRRTWITPGTYTFKVLAEDTSHARSRWVSTSIDISKRPPTVALGLGDCAIGEGQSTCSGRVNWVFTNGDSPYLVKNINGTPVGTAVSGDVATILRYGDNTFEALDNGKLLDTRTIKVGCADGLVWRDDECVLGHVPTISLRVESALIRMRGTTNLKWTISDLVENTCTIKGPSLTAPVEVKDKSGSLPVGPITSLSTFTLTCASSLHAHADVSTSATVEVIPSVTEN
jgi:hypothetical protein